MFVAPARSPGRPGCARGRPDAVGETREKPGAEAIPRPHRSGMRAAKRVAQSDEPLQSPRWLVRAKVSTSAISGLAASGRAESCSSAWDWFKPAR